MNPWIFYRLIHPPPSPPHFSQFTGHKIIMTNTSLWVQKYLLHLPEHHMLICRYCIYAIRSTGRDVQRHLLETYKNMGWELGATMTLYAHDLDLLSLDKVLTKTWMQLRRRVDKEWIKLWISALKSRRSRRDFFVWSDQTKPLYRLDRPDEGNLI